MSYSSVKSESRILRIDGSLVYSSGRMLMIRFTDNVITITIIELLAGLGSQEPYRGCQDCSSLLASHFKSQREDRSIRESILMKNHPKIWTKRPRLGCNRQLLLFC